MKAISLYEVPQNADFSKLFVGIVTKVDTEQMILDVEIVNIPGTIRASAPFKYVSAVTGSFEVFVPKEGDRVIVGMAQVGQWEVLGYRPLLSSPTESTWLRIKESEETVQPPGLLPGDYAVCVHEKDKSVDFFMLANGTLLMSAGLVYFVMNQVANSLQQVMGHCSWDNGKLSMEWGEARIGEQVVLGESLWQIQEKIKAEQIALGHVHKEGKPVQSRLGNPVRFRVQIGQTEILVDQAGGVEINATERVEFNIAQGGTVRINPGLCNIVINKTEIEGEVSVTGNTTVTGNVEAIGNAEVSGYISAARSEIGGSIGVLLETILPVLTAHTHPTPTGPSSPSMELSNISSFASRFLKGA